MVMMVMAGEAFYVVTRRTLGLALLATLVLCVLARGSVNPLACSAFASVVGVLSALGLLTLGEPKATARVLRIATILAVLLVGWVVVQVLPIKGLTSPAWHDVSEFVAARSATISVAPADSLAALVTLTLPFAVFIAALTLFPSDEEALRLLSFIAVAGGAISIWAIVEFRYFPHSLLAGEKRYYLDSLTAPFVNRNTAGTFYGMISLLLTARLSTEARRTDFKSLFLKTEPIPGKRSVGWRLGMYSFFLLTSLVALLLTKSRGGVGCTFVAYLLFIPMVLWDSPAGRSGRASFAPRRRHVAWRLAKATGGLLGIILVGLIFAGQVLFRAEIQGLDDNRFCIAPAILRAAGDNHLTGVGFATFRLFFPAYRDAECGVSGVWDRAHSVYLEAYLGLGWVFVPILIVGIATLVWTFVRGVGTRRSLRVYPIAGLAILVLVLAHSGIDFSLQIPGFAVTFAAVMAGLITVSRGRLYPSTTWGRPRSNDS